MSADNVPLVIEPAETGHILDLPAKSEGQESDGEVQLSMAEQIAQATHRRDELLQQRQLEEIRREIDILERGETRSPSGVDVKPIAIDVESGSKRPLDETFVPASKRRNIRPMKLPDYLGKSRREHREWVQDADVAFELTPWNFENDHEKILWAMQSLKGDPKEQWHNERDRDRVATDNWSYFVTFLLNRIQDPVDRQLDANQTRNLWLNSSH